MEAHPALQSFEFVFDDKPEIASHASAIHRTITTGIRDSHAGVFLDGISFVPDEASPQIQAADLLVYEWRKRITNARLTPDRAERPSFPRMRPDPGAHCGATAAKCSRRP